MRRLLFLLTVFPAVAMSDQIAELYPVAENVRGHENTEWSISYAYHLTDAKKSLPRVLLVGDSICQGYQGKVRAKLEGKANVTYWASSYCVDTHHYTDAGYEILASQVVEKITAPMATSRDGGTD